MGKTKSSQGEKKVIMTFTVAECGEYHNLGEYHEGIATLEKAVMLYRQIPPERMNAVPSIGISLHVEGTAKMEDSQADILCGSEIDVGLSALCRSFTAIRRYRKL